MKRTWHGASAARREKRRCACGSRSIATSVPDAPRRCATRRAWPPSPKVQSIAVWPGCGSSSSSSSRASTGTWFWRAARRSVPAAGRSRAGPLSRRRTGRRRDDGMSSSVVDTCGDLRDAAEQRRSIVVPALFAPHLQAVSRADHDHLPVKASVLAEEARDHDPARRVELAVLGAAEEEALELGQARRERRQVGERTAAVAGVLLRLPDADAGLVVDEHPQDDAVGERRAVASGDGEPFLRIERVIEGAAKENHW